MIRHQPATVTGRSINRSGARRAKQLPRARGHQGRRLARPGCGGLVVVGGSVRDPALIAQPDVLVVIAEDAVDGVDGTPEVVVPVGVGLLKLTQLVGENRDGRNSVRLRDVC